MNQDPRLTNPAAVTQPRTDVMVTSMKDFGIALQNNGVTGDEYIIILHNLVAQLLSANPKRVEKDFFEFVKRDVLQRRLQKLREANPDLAEELDRTLAQEAKV